MFTLSNNSKRNREGCDSRLIEISDLAIQITLVDFGHGKDAGLRDAERQNELYKADKSNADGYVKIGKHQANEEGESEALDFYAYVDGKASWEPEHLAMVATAFLQAASILGYKIKWGGLWKTTTSNLYGWDMPHVQLLEVGL